MEDIDDFLMTLFLLVVTAGFSLMVFFPTVIERIDADLQQSHRFETTVDKP